MGYELHYHAETQLWYVCTDIMSKRIWFATEDEAKRYLLAILNRNESPTK